MYLQLCVKYGMNSDGDFSRMVITFFCLKFNVSTLD